MDVPGRIDEVCFNNVVPILQNELHEQLVIVWNIVLCAGNTTKWTVVERLHWQESGQSLHPSFSWAVASRGNQSQGLLGICFLLLLWLSYIFEKKVNTLRAEYVSQGMNHFEGGWPKDINPQENDQTMRFRKKIEKDDTYINTVLGLCTVSTVYAVLHYTYFYVPKEQFIIVRHSTPTGTGAWLDGWYACWNCWFVGRKTLPCPSERK